MFVHPTLAVTPERLPLGVLDTWLVARKPLPGKPPTLNEVIRVIAGFGGFLGHQGDGESGAKTLWIGLQRVMDFAMGIRAMRESQSCIGRDGFNITLPN
jgi:hypothetical protein